MIIKVCVLTHGRHLHRILHCYSLLVLVLVLVLVLRKRYSQIALAETSSGLVDR